MYYTTRGIVLREVTYKESDKILTVLTEDLGKCTVKAQGCRRKDSPLAAGSQLRAYSDLTLFSRQDRLTLREASTISLFRHMRQSLEQLALGTYFAQCVEAVTEEGQREEEILSLLLNSLYALDTLQKPLPLVKAVFEVRLMALAGFAPLCDSCAVCGAREIAEAQIHLGHGVLHCPACRGKLGPGISMPLGRDGLLALQYLLSVPGKQMFSFRLGGEGLEQLGNFSEAFLLTQLERGFSTLDFYKQVIFS